jgi:sugar lactone lactonase YvrE
VYRVTQDAEITRLPGSEAIGFPNGLVFGEDGELYVSDSMGAIWVIPEDGSAELWFEDPLLVGDDSFPPPFPIGANGIEYNDEEIYVTNTELGTLVEIEIDGDTGEAEDPEVLVEDPALVGADGLAVDEDGKVYVAVISQSTILRIDEDDHEIEEVIADGDDGLDWTSSLAFGRGEDDEETLYAVNFSTGPFFGGTRTHGPALLAIEAGVEGRPLP